MSVEIKYLQVKEHLLELIRQGGEGDRLPSEAQLARKFGVSRITIRKAMEQLEAETLIIRKKGHGTFIRDATTYTDGIKRLLVVCNLNHLPRVAVYVRTILAGCYAGTASNDCVLSLAPSSLGRQALIDLAGQLDVHGVIGITPYEHQNEILEELRVRGYPILVVNRVLRNSHLSYISTDHTQSGALGTEFLLERGHRRIGFATVIPGVSYTNQEFEGYEQAMRLGGGVLDDCGIVKVDREDSLRQFHKILLTRFEAMIRDYRPTAVVFNPHQHLSAILDLIDRMGLGIPDDLELVVRDLDNIEQDIPQRPLLHELRQPFFEMGIQAVRQMNQLIETGGPRITRTLDPHLEIKTPVLAPAAAVAAPKSTDVSVPMT